MKKKISILSCGVILVFLTFAAAGCSSSQTSDADFGDEVPAADAGTDAVPNAAPENPADTANSDQQADDTQSLDAPAPPPPADSNQVAASDPMAAPDQAPPPPAAPDATAQADANTPAPPTMPDNSAAPADATAQDTQTPPPAAVADSQAQAPDSATTTPDDTASTDQSSTPDNSMAAADSGSSETYRVRRGDTLMRIAFRKYGDLYKWRQIYQDNRDKIQDPNVIRPGVVLTLNNVNNNLPPRTGHRYRIRQGDTLATISSDVYGTPHKWTKIWKHNKAWIPNPNRIFAGFYVYYTMSERDRADLERYRQDSQAAPMAQEQQPDQTQPEQAQPAGIPQQPQVPPQQQAMDQQQAAPPAQAAPRQPASTAAIAN